MAAIIFPQVGHSFEEIVIFPENKHVYFYERGFLSSNCIHFRPNSTYSKFYVSNRIAYEEDRGKWEQGQNGEIILISDIESEGIEYGALKIQLITKLEALRENILVYLKDNLKDRFTADEVRNIYGLYCGPDVQLPMIETISEGPFSREDLLGLANTIDRYLKGDKNRIYHVIPIKYKNITFLLWKGDALPIHKNIIENKKSIDDSIKYQSHPYLYIAIDKEEFEWNTQFIDRKKVVNEGNQSRIVEPIKIAQDYITENGLEESYDILFPIKIFTSPSRQDNMICFPLKHQNDKIIQKNNYLEIGIAFDINILTNEIRSIQTFPEHDGDKIIVELNEKGNYKGSKTIEDYNDL